MTILELFKVIIENCYAFVLEMGIAVLVLLLALE